jgi:hypothetical protein
MSDDHFKIIDLFPQSAIRWPPLADRFAEASKNLAGTAVLVRTWRREELPKWLPLNDYQQSLAAWLVAYAILTTERSLDLCNSVARNIEDDRLFSAGTTARAQLEVVGHIL